MNKTYYSPNIGQLGVVPRISGLRSTFKIPRENSTIFEWAEENVTSTQENRSLIQNNKLKTNENSSPSAAQRSLQPQVHESAYSSDCDSEDNEFSDFVLVRNRSINEIHTNCGAVPKTSTSNNGDADNHGEKKLGHRRVAENGEVTYKKINSSHIMHSIQLGLSHAVGGLSEKPERDILMQDFKTTESTSFTFEGSKQMPDAHRFSDFRFESFAPIAFQYFRNLFCINPQDFLLSLCNQPLRELSNPGASGSIFYLSSDDEFIIKTVQHKEGEFLKKLLPGYNMNLNQNPRTLLPKFFGFYCYICNAKNVRMVVMNNLLPSSMKLHEKYDLKGSTCNRKASREERSKTVPTFKDLDFLEIHPEGISLEADTYNALIKTIERDCRVLESFKIMDYSLLLAIHNLDLAAKEEAKTLIQHSSIHFQNNGSRSINRRKLVAHSTTMESIQMNGETIGELENYVPYDGIPARNAKGERLLVFLGIIDILQSYRLEKKLEHTLKSTIYDGDSISVHRPDFYSKRFRNFTAKQVFRKVSLSY